MNALKSIATLLTVALSFSLANSDAVAQTHQQRLNYLQAQIALSQMKANQWAQLSQNVNRSIGNGQFQHNGYRGHANRNGIGGGYQSEQQQYSANFRRQSGNFNYRQKEGPNASGGYVTDGRGNFIAQGGYQNQGIGYGGLIARKGNNTRIHGSYSRPGTLPGTVENFHAGVNARGRQSSLYSGGSINHARSGQRLGGRENQMSGRGMSQRTDYNVGRYSGNKSANVRFQGINSNVNYKYNVKAGPHIQKQANFNANRQRVSGGANMRVGNNNFGVSGSISRKGVNAKLSFPGSQSLSNAASRVFGF